MGCQEKQVSSEEREKENSLGSFEVSLLQAAWCMILQCALPDNTCNFGVAPLRQTQKEQNV